MNAPTDDARRFAHLSQQLMSDRNEAPTFEHVARSAVDVVPPCDMAGISLLRGGRVVSVAATDDLVAECDELQHALQEGPCVEAATHDEFYVSLDLATESRWPRWSAAAAARGMGSVVSVKLSTEDETLGALNFYGRSGAPWNQDHLDIALVYAVHATNAMVSARLVDGLTTALNRRHTIGIAEGVLMSVYDLGIDAAFDLLSEHSRSAGVPLHEAARIVVEARGLPADHVEPVDEL